MPDSYRGAGRFDLRLNGRQAAGIVAGALVTLGITFAIGVGFGHRLAVTPPPEKPGDPTADARNRSDAGPKKTVYTYQGELTKTDQPVVAAAPPKPAPVAPKAVAPPPAPVPVPPPDSDTPAPGAEAAAKPASDGHDEAPDDEVLAALKKAPPPAADTETSAADRYTVQFGAPSKREDADRLAGKLAGFGYSPFVVEADIPGKGIFFRVRVGHFGSKDDADTFRDEAASENRIAGMVMPSK